MENYYDVLIGGGLTVIGVILQGVITNVLNRESAERQEKEKCRAEERESKRKFLDKQREVYQQYVEVCGIQLAVQGVLLTQKSVKERQVAIALCLNNDISLYNKMLCLISDIMIYGEPDLVGLAQEVNLKMLYVMGKGESVEMKEVQDVENVLALLADKINQKLRTTSDGLVG